MKVIFLDIDGVLLNFNDSYNCLRGQFSPECVKEFNKLIERTDAQIVFSSAWRLDRTIPEIQQLLEENGVKGKVSGKTPEEPPRLTQRASRGNEIKMWLTENKVDNFVILDDDVFDIEIHFPDNTVRMKDRYVGLTEEEVNKAFQILNN